MSNVNSVCISGRLTRDAELRAAASGAKVLTVPVAVNERRRDASKNEWVDFPCFVDCTVFGARAEALSKVLGRGSGVSIQGHLRMSKWVDREGVKRTKLEVVVDEIDVTARVAPGQAKGAPEPEEVPADAYGCEYDPDEFPF